MLFNTLNYVLFLPVVCLFYYVVPSKWRWLVLLFASIVFYACFGWAVLALILGVSAISFFTGLWIETTNNKSLALKTTLFLFIGYLFVFKYLNFGVSILNDFLKLFDQKANFSVIHLLMPVGVSYYIFQIIGYHIDIANSKIEAEKNPLKLITFLLFFPKILQGPVERTRNVIPQFEENHSFCYSNFTEGCKRILWGFFLKLVLADRIALLVGNYSSDIISQGSISTILFLIFYNFQLYFDFMGYSEIAIGTSKLFGIKLIENFNKPFFAKNITDYWRRWHISLSTWLNEYVFNQLAISWRNIGKYAVHLAVFVTFLISGLWHGAGFNYIVWGGLHGLALAYEIQTKKWRKSIRIKTPKWIYDGFSQFLTFSFVCIALLFFRAKNFVVVNEIFQNLIHGWGSDITKLCNGEIDKVLFLSVGKFSFTLLFIIVFIFFIIENKLKGLSWQILNLPNPILRWTIYISVLTIIAFFGQFHSEAEFIYVNF